MDISDNIGIFRLTKYPKLELYSHFTEALDQSFLEQFYVELDSKIKVEYIKYIVHLVVTFMIAVTLFYLGFYFYESLFPLSVTFSVLFVGVFIYASKAIEIKARYFKFFKFYFPKSFSRFCSSSYNFSILMKKKKFLIFLTKVI